jgi:DNA repair protein RadA/Sms
MAKDKTVYVCDYCGQESVKWMGKCPACGQWGTMKEMKIAPLSKTSRGNASTYSPAGENEKAVPLHEIDADAEPRIDMNDGELNRVLGGGLVPGSLVLLGGEPGIGKSTLTLQTVLQLQGRRILYVSGEESARQIKLRADRLGPKNEGLYVLCETSLETIFQHIEEMQPDLVVIDSIQTVQTETVES